MLYLGINILGINQFLLIVVPGHNVLYLGINFVPAYQFCTWAERNVPIGVKILCQLKYFVLRYKIFVPGHKYFAYVLIFIPG
jgi:hypothetical protein